MRPFVPVAALLSLALAIAAAPAAALVTPVASPRFGVEPHSVTPMTKEPTLPLAYHGGPVMHSTAIYAIYWDPTRSVSWNYDGDWKQVIDQYLQAVGRQSGTLSNVFAVASQYTDSSGKRASYSSVFHGAYTDTSSYPSTGGCTDPHPEPEKFACLTDAQLRAELDGFIAAHSLPTGLGTLYFLLTPPGVTVCTDGGGALSGHCSDSTKQDPWASEEPLPSPQEIAEQESYDRSFCGYHSYTGSQSDPVVYAVQPWTAGNLGMYLPFTEKRGSVLGSDCQDGTEAQQEPNQLSAPGLDTDGDYDEGLADIIVNELSVEQLAAETDPLLTGWYAPSGKANQGNEVTDQCRNWFGNASGESKPPAGSLTGAGTLANQTLGEHHYFLNDEFNQAALSMDYPGVPCLTEVGLEPKFTAPNAVNAGEIVGFDAAESDISLDSGINFSSGSPYQAFPTYIWDFGDGTKTTSSNPSGAEPADEPSAFHSYTYGGTYTVTLTVTDVGGNTASVSHQVTVVGPPRPSPPAPSTSSSTPTPTTSAATSTAAVLTPTTPGPKAPHKGVPAPIVTEHVGSHLLTDVLREGLLVHYTVNEQVAGIVEVMLDRATAHRLGMHRSAAKHLPRGYARSVLLGSAVLVTTRHGRGELKIELPKGVAERLAQISRVKLTLRIVVRNAVRQRPKTTTLLSTVVLKG